MPEPPKPGRPAMPGIFAMPIPPPGIPGAPMPPPNMPIPPPIPLTPAVMPPPGAIPAPIIPPRRAGSSMGNIGAAGCSGLRRAATLAPAFLSSMMRPTLASTPAWMPCTFAGLERTLMVCSEPPSVRIVKLNTSVSPVSHCVICVKGNEPRRSLPGGGPSKRRPARSSTVTTGLSPAGVCRRPSNRCKKSAGCAPTPAIAPAPAPGAPSLSPSFHPCRRAAAHESAPSLRATAPSADITSHPAGEGPSGIPRRGDRSPRAGGGRPPRGGGAKAGCGGGGQRGGREGKGAAATRARARATGSPP